MDRTATDDQRMLLDASTRFIEDFCPLERVRGGGFAGPADEVAYRHRAAELGWYSMLVPEQLGGGSVSGNGMVDAAMIAYRRGAALQPGSFVGTTTAGYAISCAGCETHRSEVLPGLISGDLAAAWAVGIGSMYGPAWGIQATATGAGFVLTGAVPFVEDAVTAQWLLVTTESPEGASQFLLAADTAGISVTPRESLDLSRRFAEVRFDNCQVPAGALVGAAGEAATVVAQQLAIACLLTAAESLGAMNFDFDMALQYAKDRIAFGRPIGSFQAVKHQLADTSLLLEMSKAIVLAAAETVGSGDDYGPAAASMAKAFVGDAGVDLAQACFQVFGGIGFTWEHDQHLYLRRVTSDAALFGSPSWHRERLCQLSGL